jgi:DNA-directed RNA polymerase specialized sigma24 family protein
MDGPKRAMGALSDAALIQAMRDSVPAAWAEFDARYRPLLEAYAKRMRIPRWDWSVCITEVLDDEAVRLVQRDGELPGNVPGFLVRAVRNRYLKLKRAAIRREKHYADAAGLESHTEQVVRGLCSEDALRASAGPGAEASDANASHALRRLALLLGEDLSKEEKQMLGWVGEGVPRRQIAEWLGVGYDAVRKRIYRLSQRMHGVTPAVLDRMNAEERAEVRRFLRRIGVRVEDQRGSR